MAKNILTKAEADQLESVIAELEKKTDGEIRLMIVSRSSRTSHVHLTLWMSLLALSFFGVWICRHEMIFFGGWWLWPALISVTFAFAVVLSRFEAVQRAFTPLADLKHQVWTRSEVEFHREGLSSTGNRTGILIFLSLMERQAVVLADRGINEKVPNNTWDDVVKMVLRGAQTGKWVDHLESALRECGKLLAQHFPPHAANNNELPNSVIIKE